jgi:type VI secretion system protein VasD
MTVIRHILSVLSALLLVTGCSNNDVHLGLVSSADLNRNSFNETLPIVVRVYQLTAVDAFNRASFEQLWQADERLLGEQLVGKHEVVLQPAVQRNYSLPLADGAKYVAVFALFRTPNDKGWRWVHKVSNDVFSRDSRFELQLINNKIYYQAD